MESFFTSVEFYVIAFIVAMTLAVFIMKPNEKGAAQTYFYTAQIMYSEAKEQSLLVEALENGKMIIIHRMVNADENTIPAIALSIIGNDIKIVEKQTPQAHPDMPFMDAVYIVDCIKGSKYHLHFDSQATTSYTSTSIRNEHPFHVEVPFTC